MTESVYFFNDNQQLIKIVGEDEIISDLQEKSLPENDLMNDRLTLSTAFDKEIEEAEYIAVRESEKVFSLYKTITIRDPENRLEFDCVGFAPNELDSYIVKDIRPQQEPLLSVAERLLEYTDGEWRLGHVSTPLPLVSGSFYYISVKEALKKLQEIGCEILFFCTITGDGITDKWIEIYDEIGEESNKRFDYGSNALSVVKEQSRGQIYTSLIGRGKGEEVGDGYGRRLEFTDVEWKKANGDAVDKPKGQNFVEIPEMTEKYGIPRKSGKKRKRENVVIFEDIEDAKELLKSTYKTLVEISRPLVQFSTDVLGADSLGNIVTVHRNDRNYHYKTRIFGVKIDRLSGKVTASLGDRITTSMPKKLASTQNGIEQLQSDKMNFYDSTEISKWQSDIIRGAKGGSILLMNPEDTGKGSSREPYQQVFMNGDSLETSDEFLVMNSKGVGFIKGDFNEDDFKTAWTIDGVFNADYIRAGILRGIEIIGCVFKTDIEAAKNYQMVLDERALTFRDKNAGDGVNNFLGALDMTKDADGKDDTLSLYKPIKSGGVTRQSGMHIDNGSLRIQHVKEVNISAPTIKLGTGVEIKDGKLYVGGQPVTGGGSGGGNPGDWDGEYPDVVNTQAEKFAWQAWTTLRGLGYNENAAAGILGNINGEAGPGMNPDTDQVGGPAYGAIQFDGSAYPLVGAPTSNGREYVQRLFSTAGIKGDYREMVPQMKLVNWAMTNGQWIGVVNPTSVSGFKNVSSPETAAYAFEENFERPQDPHPERQGFARNWYNKFHGVPLSSNNGYAYPIAKPITVTSEFGWRTSPINGAQELHNGIDLVNGNPTTPIYAADGGEVVIAGSYPDWYGNYVVIKHSGGLFTGYAHQSQLRVSVGDTVKKGQQIGNMGTTGPSTGNHLHFQFFKNGPWPSTSDFINPREKMTF